MKERGFKDKKSGGWLWLGIHMTPEPRLTVSGHQPSQEVPSGLDTLDILDIEMGLDRDEQESSISNMNLMSNMSNTSTVEATTERERENVLMMCLVLMSRYPNEVAKGGMLERAKTDAAYWVYRLEDAGLGSYSEAIVASTLETLRARGEL